MRPGTTPNTAKPAADSKKDRLAQALRRNLQRRKAAPRPEKARPE